MKIESGVLHHLGGRTGCHLGSEYGGGKRPFASMTDAADDALQGIWNGLHAHWELKLGLVAIVVLLNLSFSRVLAQGRDAKNDNRADENSPKTVLLVTGTRLY
jgi:hypothetical protein